jgi:hypothetical protein
VRTIVPARIRIAFSVVMVEQIQVWVLSQGGSPRQIGRDRGVTTDLSHTFSQAHIDDMIVCAYTGSRNFSDETLK